MTTTCEDPTCQQEHTETDPRYRLPIVVFKAEGAPTFTASINYMVQSLLTDCAAQMRSSITTNQDFYDHINAAVKAWAEAQEGEGPYVVAEIVFDPVTGEQQ